MSELAFEDITDLVAGTLKHLGRMKFQQIAQNLQDYEVVGNWFKRDKVQFDYGVGIQRNIMGSLSKQARHTGAMTTDSVDIPTLMVQLALNWRHAQVPWAFEYQELLMNRGEALVFNVVKPRRVDALLSMAEELEAKAWTLTTSGDKLMPWGLPYWIVYSAVAAPGGFNGGAPSGFTTVGGIDPTVTTNFKNYCSTYVAVTKLDLIKTMRQAHRKIRWRAPVNVADYGRGGYGNLRLYTDNTTIAAFEDLGEAQNENLGRDLGRFGGAKDVKYVEEVLTFRRHPLIYVPQIDDTSVFTAATNPVYMIDHSTFYPVCLAGDYLREGEVIRAPNQHNLFRIFIDLTYNYLCVDRRRNAVFSK
jgi:hypothetical protein